MQGQSEVAIFKIVSMLISISLAASIYYYIPEVIYLLMLLFCCSAGQICSQSFTMYQVFYSPAVEYYHQGYRTGCGFLGWSTCDRIR